MPESRRRPVHSKGMLEGQKGILIGASAFGQKIYSGPKSPAARCLNTSNTGDQGALESVMKEAAYLASSKHGGHRRALSTRSK